jgi:hypothetical protein
VAGVHFIRVRHHHAPGWGNVTGTAIVKLHRSSFDNGDPKSFMGMAGERIGNVGGMKHLQP